MIAQRLVALSCVGVLLGTYPPATTAAQPPAELMAVDGSALVPMRFIGQWLGAQVAYDARTLGITFSLGEHVVKLKLNSREASADNLPILLAAPPMEVKGTTYVPLGFLALYLGVKVDWDEQTRIATVTHPVTGQKLMLQMPGGEAPAAPTSQPTPAPPRPQPPAQASPDAPAWLHVSGSVQLPGEMGPDEVFVSDDGAHWAFIETTDSGERVVDDRGATAALYQHCRGLRFAPVSSRLAYWGVSADRKVALVVDGKEYATTFVRPGMVLFSPNGQRWAAVGWEGDPTQPASRVATVLVDGAEAGRYWDAGIPSFTPDGAHCAFLAVDSATKRLIVVRDGVAGDVSSDAAIELMYAVGPNMAFQTDLGYACDGSLFSICHGERGWQVMLDSHIIATYRISKFCQETRASSGGFDVGHIVYPSSLVVADNAPVAAWWARPQPSSPWVCCLTGREFPANEEVDPAEDRITISPDGQHVAFRLRHFEGQGDQRRQVAETVCLDGKNGPKFDAVAEIAFSPDSQRCVYRAERAGSSRVLYVLDSQGAGPDAEEVSLFSFSPDSRHYAYLARHGEANAVVVDGTEWRIPWPEVLMVEAISDGGVRLVAREDRQLLTVTGAPSSPFS
ncbi:MAG: copper amine oxidase N-terminal domain-containing protein [Armatimonadetes bacterium]|nr:copper amine oxidase N-terminal domain-containing protein [Armatimonadota bacterium]